MTFESQYRFANISAMKAWIGMKFKNYFYMIVKNYQLIFCKDSCIHADIRGNNMRARFLSRQNAQVHIYVSCLCVCVRIFMKNQQVILYYLINITFKFHKDPMFRCGDICWLSKVINFQCILHISTVLLLQSLQRWIITEWLWNFFESRYQNGPTSVTIWHMSHLIDYFLAWEISEYIILFIIEDPVEMALNKNLYLLCPPCD